MAPATITLTDLTTNLYRVHDLADVFTIGFRTQGMDVNIHVDDNRDWCCRESFHLQIVRRSEGGHGLVFPKQSNNYTYIPPVRINHDWVVIEPNQEKELRHGDFIICGCQYERDTKIHCGPCSFEYRVQAGVREESPQPNAESQLKQKRIEELPEEVLQAIFSRLDPTYVATNVAAACPEFFQAAHVKVPFRTIKCDDQGAAPCEVRLWTGVVAEGHVKNLALTSNSETLVDQLVTLVSESGLTSLTWRHKRSNLLGGDFDVVGRLFDLMERSPELKYLALLGQFACDAALWLMMPAIPNVQELVVKGCHRFSLIHLEPILEKTRTENLLSLHVGPHCVYMEEPNRTVFHGLKRAVVRDLWLPKCLFKHLPDQLTTLDVAGHARFCDLEPLLEQFSCSNRLVNLRINTRSRGYDLERWYKLIRLFPEHLEVLEIMCCDFREFLEGLIVNRCKKIRIFSLGIFGKAQPNAVCYIGHSFYQRWESLEMLSVNFYQGDTLAFTSNLDNVPENPHQESFIRGVPMRVRRESAAVRNVLDDIFVGRGGWSR